MDANHCANKDSDGKKEDGWRNINLPGEFLDCCEQQKVSNLHIWDLKKRKLDNSNFGQEYWNPVTLTDESRTCSALLGKH